MYGETGAAMRQEFAELLRQHRVQQRLGGTPAQRQDLGDQIRQYRQNILIWCGQALESTSPLTFSNQAPAQPNPFRSAGTRGDGLTPANELARLIALAASESTARPATIDQLTAATGHEMVEHWRAAAAAAVLAEHDTAPQGAARMTAPQAQAVVGDVAAITQALVVLDRRCKNMPSWEPLSQGYRLGWAALATALDVNLGQPDYTVDALGWHPKTKPIDGPARPGILGVLQAEHNLVVRMKAFPNATNLRYVIGSQRLMSRHLVPLAARIDQRLADRWAERAASYARLQRLLRPIAGRVGKGGFAAAEGALAVSRLRDLPTETVVEPRVLGGFQLLFDRLDHRIADVVQEGIDRRAYFHRVSLPRLVEGGGDLVAPIRERFVPIDRNSNPELIEAVRAQLRPQPDVRSATAGSDRANLQAALIHRPASRDVRAGPTL